MALGAPIPFKEAYDAARKRGILKTDLNTKQLAELPVWIRRMALFSSTVSDARILERIHKEIQQLVEGVSPGPGQYTNESTINLRLTQLLDSIQYHPEIGDEGTIKDLRTDGRLDLIINTQRDMAQAAGAFEASNNEDSLMIFPCRELYRLESRETPRGFVRIKGDLVEKEGDPGYWRKRWTAAGGRLFDGRMVARFDDPVWSAISRFGNPYPPFDFNSGYWTRKIRRTEAVKLGVIDRSEKVQPVKGVTPTDNMTSDVSELSADILDALGSVIDPNEFQITPDGVLTFAD